MKGRKRTRKLKLYWTSIYLHSEGRRDLFGAFSSWRKFAEALGVSTTKAAVDGNFSDLSKASKIFKENPGKVFERVGWGSKAEYIPFKKRR